jgi:hypothetical protein
MSSSSATPSFLKRVEGLCLQIATLQDLKPTALATTTSKWREEFLHILVSKSIGSVIFDANIMGYRMKHMNLSRNV